MNTVPDEMFEGEYSERLDRIKALATGMPSPQVKDGEMVIVSTTNGVYPAEVEQTLDDNTILLYFWNGQGGPVRAKSAIYPAYLEPPAELNQGGVHIFSKRRAVD
jgi:hypothetical protein